MSRRKNEVRIIYSARYDGELMDFSVAGKLLSCRLTVNLSFLVVYHTYRMCLEPDSQVLFDLDFFFPDGLLACWYPRRIHKEAASRDIRVYD